MSPISPTVPNFPISKITNYPPCILGAESGDSRSESSSIES